MGFVSAIPASGVLVNVEFDFLPGSNASLQRRISVLLQLRISKQRIMQEEMEMLQEREKKERAERLRVNRILDDLNISLAMVEAQGTILQINKEFQRMFGFSQSQAQGKQMKELLGLEEIEFKDKHSEISLRDVSGKRIKMSVRSNRVELQEQDEYIVIMIPAETSEQETESVVTRSTPANGDSESTEEIAPNELLRQNREEQQLYRKHDILKHIFPKVNQRVLINFVKGKA